MSRLIVEAVSGESKFIDIVFQLELFVSVCDAATGAPVSGLMLDNFRLCAPSGALFDTVIAAGTEAAWDGSKEERAGCYSLSISISKESSKTKREWIEGEYYPFGIQAFYTDDNGQTHMGQTVVRVQSLGK
jgi:hypothetical protein